MSDRRLQRHRILPALPSNFNSSGQSRFTYASDNTVRPSQSLPDLSASLRNRDKYKFGILSSQTKTNHPVRIAGSSRSSSSISLHAPTRPDSYSPIPKFKQRSVLESKIELPNTQEMLLGALRAGTLHYPRGMKAEDILEVIYSVYTNFRKTTTSDASLKRKLDSLVAKGIVSRSFGAKPSDATYRAVSASGMSTSCMDSEMGLNLAVSGVRIKSTLTPQFTTGQGLPSGNNFQTRIANSHVPQRKPVPLPSLKQKLTKLHSSHDKYGFEAFPAAEQHRLSKSFAFQAGALKTLKPSERLLNSPVSNRDEEVEETGFRLYTPPPQTPLLRWEEDSESEDENQPSLSQRFREYSEAVGLKEIEQEIILTPAALDTVEESTGNSELESKKEFLDLHEDDEGRQYPALLPEFDETNEAKLRISRSPLNVLEDVKEEDESENGCKDAEHIPTEKEVTWKGVEEVESEAEEPQAAAAANTKTWENVMRRSESESDEEDDGGWEEMENFGLWS